MVLIGVNSKSVIPKQPVLKRHSRSLWIKASKNHALQPVEAARARRQAQTKHPHSSNTQGNPKRVISLAKTPSSEIIKALKHDNLSVNSRVASAIGKIVMFLGLDHKSSREMLSRAVSLI